MGIAEQHAVTSAAGLALGGMHPVVAVYSMFLNRAFDQVIMDVALLKLPVTFVLDRAGITGPDGASHNGVWDLSLLGIVPGMRVAAPRDASSLREQLGEALGVDDGPTAIRFRRDRWVPILKLWNESRAWMCFAARRIQMYCWSRSGRWRRSR